VLGYTYTYKLLLILRVMPKGVTVALKAKAWTFEDKAKTIKMWPRGLAYTIGSYVHQQKLRVELRRWFCSVALLDH